MVKRPDREWIAGQLSTLMEHAPDLVELDPTAVNEYRPLTALKLIVLSAAVDMYTDIAPGQYDGCFYLDLFAGSGVTRIRGRDEAVVGSPILVPMIADPDLKEYHFVDNDEDSVDALRGRIQYMDDQVDHFPGDRCQVHHDDATDFTHSFLDDRRDELGLSYKGLNLFTFIDPEGLDIQWNAIRRLADVYGDLLVNFPKLGANRSLGSSKSRMYFGGSDHEELRSQEQRRQHYEEKLKGCDNTGITVPIRIDSGRSAQHFHYDLIYATRKTPNNSPYVAAVKAMQTKLKVLDGDDIDRVMDTIYGDVTALDDILPDSGQSGLERY